jgi:hypothetical protein
MTLTEKQQLRKLIQNLPPKNLDRVVEIIQHGKLTEAQSRDEFVVDLEKEVNKNVHILYGFYLEFLILQIMFYRIIEHFGDCTTTLKQLKRLECSRCSSIFLIFFR